MTVKAIVSGYTGRMGQEIGSVAREESIEILGGLSRDNGSLKTLLATLNGKSTGSNAIRPDVVIDFSLPEATRGLLEECKSLRLPLVSGVTGYSALQMSELKLASKEIPILHSSNMSIGIQLLARALEVLKAAPNYDIVIEDIHHRHKKDRPSGTALFLRDELKARTGRDPSEVISIRGGGVIGDHRVMAFSESETLTFQHTALNRSVFARGACRAARWLAGRQPGFYSLRDVLETD